MSDHLPAYMAALAVALSARTGGLTLHMVDDMRTKAEELLARDDPLRSAILTFCTMYEQDSRDAAALAAHGEDLQRAVQWVTAPAPAPERVRRDIDG